MPQPLLACRDKTFPSPHDSSYKLFLVYIPIRSSQQSLRLFHLIWFPPCSLWFIYQALYKAIHVPWEDPKLTFVLTKATDNAPRSPGHLNATSFTHDLTQVTFSMEQFPMELPCHCFSHFYQSTKDETGYSDNWGDDRDSCEVGICACWIPGFLVQPFRCK